MKDLSKLVGRLKGKTNLLAEKYELLTNKYQQLEIENDQLKKELNEKKEDLTEMTEKIKLLKISNSLNDESTRDVKLKINEMVREIDKCIAQINR